MFWVVGQPPLPKRSLRHAVRESYPKKSTEKNILPSTAVSKAIFASFNLIWYKVYVKAKLLNELLSSKFCPTTDGQALRTTMRKMPVHFLVLELLEEQDFLSGRQWLGKTWTKISSRSMKKILSHVEIVPVAVKRRLETVVNSIFPATGFCIFRTVST